MQIPNLKYYITFIYNTLTVYDELFAKLYSEHEFQRYVENSNSYILFIESFNDILDIVKLKSEYVNTTHHASILQIWHYYVLSIYDENMNIRVMLDSFENIEINPIILAGFVKSGKGKNKEIFDYIKRTYSAIENKPGEPSYWMWWLPLMVIYMKDGKAYSQFYGSMNFHSIYKLMKEDFIFEEGDSDTPYNHEGDILEVEDTLFV